MKGGINFEEWKEIVKKNRRSLRSKSNSFKFEPESLTYGAERAVESPEYGQVHTITYNVTGMEVPSDWPTEIKSGKTLTLEITIPYGATGTASTDIPYTYESGILTIPNIQNNLSITIEVGVPLYENAKIGDYLYSDWTFGPTEKPGYLGRCFGLSESFRDGKSRWVSDISSEMYWADIASGTVNVDTSLQNISDVIFSPLCGRQSTDILLNLTGDITYTAAEYCSNQFDGLGYLPSYRELDICLGNTSYDTSYYFWTSDEYSSYSVWTRRRGTTSPYTQSKHNRAFCLAFMDLSGPCGRPVNNNGHEYVDLGLPSGTLWATMNVGASSETDYGNYYMYGMGSKTYDSTDTPYDGTENPLDLSKDTARVVWGGDWHMPTNAQCNELIANTNYESTTIDGIKGGKFTAKDGSGNYIFIPCAGWWDGSSQERVGVFGTYWTSTDPETMPYYLYFFGSSKSVGTNSRNYGYSVRPVIG